MSKYIRIRIDVYETKTSMDAGIPPISADVQVANTKQHPRDEELPMAVGAACTKAVAEILGHYKRHAERPT